MQKSSQSGARQADLFSACYEQLLTWALQLTDSDRQQAEELVHNVFVKFALAKPDIDRIEDVNAYLYAALRNTYRSQLKRSHSGSDQQLTLIDYDSADLGLRAADMRHAIQVQTELRLICRYACLRRLTSKAGSVLILRYFLGYYPSEIALIAVCERQAIAELLRVARAEAWMYVNDPQHAKFVEQASAPEIHRINTTLATDELLSELQDEIFKSRQGQCLPRTALFNLYQGAAAAPLDRETLAHLVTCPACLDAVNNILGLPPLSDRNPTDSIGPDAHPKSGAGGGAVNDEMTAQAEKRYRNRVRQVQEHDPKELRVAVDGDILCAQAVSSETSKLTVNIEDSGEDRFVEVFSEQGLRLAYLIVKAPPAGEFQQHEFVELSDGRTLEVGISFKGASPSMQVVYHNPGLRMGIASPADDKLPVPDRPVDAPIQEPFSSTARSSGRWQWIASLWRGWELVPARLALVGIVLVLVAVAAVVMLHRRPAPPPAKQLMRLAAEAEQQVEETVISQPSQAFHRTLEIQATRADSTVVAKRRVETWQNAGKGLRVRRLYNERQQLIAGEWQTRDGARKLYRRGIKPRQHAATPLPDSTAANQIVKSETMPAIDDLWQLDLSVHDFTTLAGRAENATVEESPTEYAVSYQYPAPGLARAVLKLNRSDLHPIEQTLLFRRANGELTVRFVEASFEQRPMVDVAPQTFEPEPELLGVAASPAHLLPRPHLSAAFEIEVLDHLSKIGADLGEEVSVTRRPGGGLNIAGVVETDDRKREILDALSYIPRSPAVTIQVETVREALTHKATDAKSSSDAAGPVQVQEYTPAEQSIPARSNLQNYFAGKLADQISGLDRASADKVIDAEIQQFAVRMVSRSQTALLHTYALKRITDRFSVEELRRLDPESRTKWFSMIGEHARRFHGEMEMLTQELRPAFQPAATAPGQENATSGLQTNPAIEDYAGLRRSVDQLLELEKANDLAIRSAFTISTQSATGSNKQTLAFLQQLESAKDVSAGIERAASRQVEQQDLMNQPKSVHP